MTTIGENIDSMAALVSAMKKKHHLTEATVLRIVDMNFALAEAAGAPTFSGDEDIPMLDEPLTNGEDLRFPAEVNEAEPVEGDDEPDTHTPTQLEN